MTRSLEEIENAPQAELLLSLRRASKTFDGVCVVRDVDLDLRAGETWGLVGPNGCGKSTVIKILAGIHRGDPGSEIVAGDGSTRVRMAFVHQDLGLVQDATILENVALGVGYRTHIGWIRASAQRDFTRRLLAEFGLTLSPDTSVGDLAPADRALVAIARAFAVLQSEPDRGVLVLDEPTASLTKEEADRVLGATAEVARRGNAVIFVSHRLEEVLSTCHRVAVMRDGRIAEIRDTAGLERETLVELMLGRAVEPIARKAASRTAEVALLEVRGLSGRRLTDVSLRVGAGEVVGVTGLLGSGKSELARLIVGAQQRSAGQISRDGEEIDIRSPRDARRAGIVFVPPDRRRQGAVLGFSAMENVTLPDLLRFRCLGLLHGRRERVEADAWMERVGVRPLAAQKLFVTFSGGNQQKIVIAKWLRLAPRVLVLDEPTQAVDVGAVSDIYRLIREHAQEGMAVLVMSTEWEDLAELCTRVYVLDDGRLVAELEGDDLTADSIAAAALAVHAHRSRQAQPSGEHD